MPRSPRRSRKHTTIQEWIRDNFPQRSTTVEATDGKHKLQLDGADKPRLYQPDCIVWKGKANSGKIKQIIEIENDPTRKQLVGTIIVADFALKFNKCGKNAELLFVVYGKSGLKQIDDFKARVEMAKKYTSTLKKIDVLTENQFKKKFAA